MEGPSNPSERTLRRRGSVTRGSEPVSTTVVNPRLVNMSWNCASRSVEGLRARDFHLGSVKCTWAFQNPAVTTRPSPGMIRASGGMDTSGPTATIRPPRMSTVPGSIAGASGDGRIRAFRIARGTPPFGLWASTPPARPSPSARGVDAGAESTDLRDEFLYSPWRRDSFRPPRSRVGRWRRAGVRPSELPRLASVHERQPFGAIPIARDVLRSDGLFDRGEVRGG